MLLKSLNSYAIALMSGFALLILLLSGILEFPSLSSSIPSAKGNSRLQSESSPDPFSDLFGAFRKWDAQVGCSQFREKHKGLVKNGSLAFQEADGELGCGEVEMGHVSVLVKGWTWVPDNLDNLYSCRCGLSCLWTKSPVLADKPDALLFETVSPPVQVNVVQLLLVWTIWNWSLRIRTLAGINLGYQLRGTVEKNRFRVC